jgi:hypothetical protein
MGRRKGRSRPAAAVALVVVGWLVLLTARPVLAWVVFGVTVAGLVAVPVWRELDRRTRKSTRRRARSAWVAPRRPAVRAGRAAGPGSRWPAGRGERVFEPGARWAAGRGERAAGRGSRWSAGRGERVVDTGPGRAAGLPGPAFERLVAGLLARDGCEGVEVSGGAGDRGADVTAITPGGHRVVVQCKAYRTRPVGDPDMQRFLGTVRHVHNAEIPLFVTTSRFTAPAALLARDHGIQLVDGPRLAAWQDGAWSLPDEPTEHVGDNMAG